MHARAFLEVATMHGLKYMTKEKWRSKELWMFLVSCCLALAIIFQIIPSLNDYNEMHRESEESTIDSTVIQVNTFLLI